MRKKVIPQSLLITVLNLLSLLSHPAKELRFRCGGKSLVVAQGSSDKEKKIAKWADRYLVHAEGRKKD